jgi:virulence factor
MSQGPNMVIKKVKVGVIGAGAIAKIAHLPSLKSNKNVEIVSIMAKHKESAIEAAREYCIEYPVESLEDMLKKDVDCIFLLTPKNIRKEFLLPILDAKLDVFCEKPLSMTLAEAEMFTDLSNKAGNIFMVGFNRRFAPVYQKAKDAFAGKKIEFVYAEKNREFVEYRGTMENAIHMIDLLRYMLGECNQVEAVGRYKDDPFYEDLCTAQLCFSSGAVALLGASRSAGQWVERMELYGSNQSVFVETPGSIRIVDNEKEIMQNMTPLAKGWARVEDTLGFKPCVDHFIECVQTRKKPLTSVEDTFLTHKLLNNVLQAAGLPDMSTDWEEK